MKMRRHVSVLLMVSLVTGCAGSEAFRQGNALLAQGQAEQGLARLQEAVRLEPRNAEYRMALLQQRASVSEAGVARAEQERAQGRIAQAQEAYRQVLRLVPDNPAARRGLDTLADEQARLAQLAQVQAEVAPVLPVLGDRQRQPISLEFNDAPLKSVLEVISRQAGINFYYDREVRPDVRVTLFARSTTVEDALRLMLATNQLEYKVLNANSLLVFPSTPQKLKEYQALAVRSFYLANADVKTVANMLKTIVKARDLMVDERLGLLFMRDTPQAIRLAERIVALQDLEDTEVMLEVEIVEVRRSRLMELGVQWPGQMSLAPLSSGGAPLTLRALGQINNSTTQARIGDLVVAANSTDADVNLLANPRIRVRNKERAKVQIGERLPIVTTTASANGFLSESVNYLDVGLKLEVEPEARSDDEVAIRINLEVSSKGQQVVTKSGTNAYQIGTRSASTMLRLRDGETQVLAGLIQDGDRQNASKIPLLGDIPLLGRLFGLKRDDQERTEILLSITPRILRAARRPAGGNVMMPAGTENDIGGDGLILAPMPAQQGNGVSSPSSSPPETAPALSTPHQEPAAMSAGDALSFAWEVPAAVKVGQRFTATLRMHSGEALRDLEARLTFDPKVLRVVSVHEGNFFNQGRAATRFQHRVSPQFGRVFLTAERPGDDHQGLASGRGDLVVLGLQALRSTTATQVSLVAARPEPEPKQSKPPSLPVAFALRVEP